MKLPFGLRHLVLIVPLALVSATACGDPAPADEGSGGGSSGGLGGNDGSGGEPEDGSGGSDDDGAGGSGGSGGSDDDGSGGSDDGSGGTGDDGSGGTDGSGGNGSGGGTTGDCGNGDLEGVEQCDDGNTVGSDACSGECTLTACDDCRADSCSDFGQYLTCEGLVDPENPSNTTLRENCETLLSCYREECADGGDSRVCYCGTGGFEPGTSEYADFMGTCFSAFAASTLQAGVCREEIEVVAATTSPIGIGTLWFDPANALGFANKTVDCELASCGAECDYEDPDGTGGTSGSGGAPGTGGTSGSGGLGGTTGSGGDSGSGGATGCHSGDTECEACITCRDTECAEEYAAAFVGVSSACLGNPSCFSYLECVDSTGCASTSEDGPDADLTRCYCGEVDEATCTSTMDDSIPQGDCRAEIGSVAQTNIPLNIGVMLLDGESTIGKVNDVLLCQKIMCESECLPYFEAP